MITLKSIDIFKNNQLHGMIHQCNCFHTMGGGIAKLVKQKFPDAYEADKKTAYGDRDKLGSFSTQPEDALSWGDFRIYNCYSQFNFGGGLETDYDAVEQCFEAVKKHIITNDHGRAFSPNDYRYNYQLGIPHGYGCGLAGGDWQTVEGIILKVFSDSPWIDVQICKLPD